MYPSGSPRPHKKGAKKVEARPLLRLITRRTRNAYLRENFCVRVSSTVAVLVALFLTFAEDLHAPIGPGIRRRSSPLDLGAQSAPA